MRRPDRRGPGDEPGRKSARWGRRASAIMAAGIRVCSALPRRNLRGISTLMRIFCAASGGALNLTAIKTGIRAGMALLGLLLAGTAHAEEAAEPLAKLELAPLELAQLEQEGWYLTEIMIFIQDDEAALGAEFWDPLPALSYPENYRYPIDLRRLDRRADEGLALASRVDARGVQSLTLPWPVTALDLAPREDALIEQPFVAENPYVEDAGAADPNAQGLSVENAPAEDLDAEDLRAVDPDAARRDADFAEPGAGESARGADSNAALAEPRRLLKALPYALLEPDRLEFTDQAQALRDRGQRILFHGAWWAPLREGDSPLPLVVDRAADPDTGAWPELQGSIRLYRSRYLHIELDLWLNTLASYLPPGWRIEPAPRPQPSLRSATPDGRPFDPWNPPPALDAGPDTALSDAGERPGNPAVRGERFSSGDERFSMGDGSGSTGDRRLSADGGRLSNEGGRLPADGAGLLIGDEGLPADGAGLSMGGEGLPATTDTALAAGAPATANEDPTAAAPWPWKHAIVHRQARRMRSNEVHYLDHPVIGVVVKVRPLSEDNLPLERDQDAAAARRERHGLALDYLEIAPREEP